MINHVGKNLERVLYFSIELLSGETIFLNFSFLSPFHRSNRTNDFIG